MIRQIACFVAALVACSPCVRADAAPPAPPGGVDAAVAPFVTEGTLLVARADPARIDIPAAEAWRVKVFQFALRPAEADEATADVAKVLPTAKAWQAAFAKAGAKAVWAVGYLGNPQLAPGVIVVPLGPDADARSIAGLLVSGSVDGPSQRTLGAGADPAQTLEAVTIGNAVVFGSVPQVEKLKDAKPAVRPNFAAALAAAGDAPVRVAFSPTFALKLLANQALPGTLPPSLGSVETHKLVNGISWAAAGIGAPPTESAHLTIKCKDAVGAKAFSRMISAGLETVQNIPGSRRNMPDADKLAAALKPTTDGDILTLDLDTKTLDETVVPQLARAIGAARRTAVRVQSSSQMRQLVTAVRMYDTEYGDYPGDLNVLASYVGGKEALVKLLSNPAAPTYTPAYVYAKPPKDAANPGEVVILYEAAGDDAEPVNVGFADGHVEPMSRAELDRRLKLQAAPAARP